MNLFNGSVHSSEPPFSHGLFQDVSREPAFHLVKISPNAKHPRFHLLERPFQLLFSPPSQRKSLGPSRSASGNRYPGEPERSVDSAPGHAGQGLPPFSPRVLFCAHRRPSGVAHHPHPAPACPRWPSGPLPPPCPLVLMPLRARFLAPAPACQMPWALSPDPSSETQPVLPASSHASTWLLGSLTHP